MNVNEEREGGIAGFVRLGDEDTRFHGCWAIGFCEGGFLVEWQTIGGAMAESTISGDDEFEDPELSE